MQPKKGLVPDAAALEISGKIGEPEGDIGHLAVTVRYPHATNDPPVGQDLDANASLVRQRKAVDASTLDLANWFLCDLDHRTPLPIFPSPSTAFDATMDSLQHQMLRAT